MLKKGKLPVDAESLNKPIKELEKSKKTRFSKNSQKQLIETA
jgi:hypothetical protein